MAAEKQEKTPLYMTFEEYNQIDANKGKNFDDYIRDYFNDRGKAWMIEAITSKQLGLISRITNDLQTLHPRISNNDIVEQFMSVVNHLERVKAKEKNLPDDEKNMLILQTWFYTTLNLISQSFLTAKGRIHDRLLETLIDGKNFKSLVDVKWALYGYPEDPKKVAAVVNNVLGAISVALSQVISSDKKVKSNAIYKERAFGVPEDNIRLKVFVEKLLNTSENAHEKLTGFLIRDPSYSRLTWLEMQKNFLQQINNSLAEEDKIKKLDIILNGEFEKLVIHSPVVDANPGEYNILFKSFNDMFYKLEQDLIKKNPNLEHYLKDQFDDLCNISSKKLRTVVPDGRPEILKRFQNDLNKLAEEIIEKLSSSKELKS